MLEEFEGEGLKMIGRMCFLGSLTGGDETRLVGDLERVLGEVGEGDDGQGGVAQPEVMGQGQLENHRELWES